MRLIFFVLHFVSLACNDINTTFTPKLKHKFKPTPTHKFKPTPKLTPTHKFKPTLKIKPTPTPTPTLKIKPKGGLIPIISGKKATLTYFTDSTTQCYGSNIPVGNAMAVNPLLLGFTTDDWINRFSNVEANKIPWCGKTMKVTVNGRNFTGTIIDTCDPVGNQFTDPVTGETIGGKCDYSNVIDLYGETGRSFLQDTVGDDFYQGDLEWEIIHEDIK